MTRQDKPNDKAVDLCDRHIALIHLMGHLRGDYMQVLKRLEALGEKVDQGPNNPLPNFYEIPMSPTTAQVDYPTDRTMRVTVHGPDGKVEDSHVYFKDKKDVGIMPPAQEPDFGNHPLRIFNPPSNAEKFASRRLSIWSMWIVLALAVICFGMAIWNW